MTKAEQDLEEAKKRVEKYCADNIEFWSITMQYAAEANLDTSGALAGDPAEIILPPVKAPKLS
jgi:hypothetical protein